MKTDSAFAKKSNRCRVRILGFSFVLLAMSLIITSNIDGTMPIFKKIRQPAMMRLNPVVHRFFQTRPTTPLESIVRHSFGLHSRTGDLSKGLDLRHVERVNEIRDYSMVIPAHLTPVSDVGGLTAQFLDYSVTSFFNRPTIKNSMIGRTAETVEKKLKAEVELGSSEPNSTHHNLKFQLKASESKASMEYRGVTNCDVSYSIASRRANLEIFEKVGVNSKLVYTHTDEPSDRRDVLSLRMHW